MHRNKAVRLQLLVFWTRWHAASVLTTHRTSKLGSSVTCENCELPSHSALTSNCQPVAGVASRQHLRSAAQRLLVVPRHQLSSYGRRTFCVAGPSVWNSLPDNLRNPIIGGNSFRQSLKTFLFATYWCIQRIRGFTSMRYINRLFTFYLLTPRGSVRAQ